MRGSRSRDTKPELAVRRLVHASGQRCRVNFRPRFPSCVAQPIPSSRPRRSLNSLMAAAGMVVPSTTFLRNPTLAIGAARYPSMLREVRRQVRRSLSSAGQLSATRATAARESRDLDEGACARSTPPPSAVEGRLVEFSSPHSPTSRRLYCGEHQFFSFGRQASPR